MFLDRNMSLMADPDHSQVHAISSVDQLLANMLRPAN